MASSGTGSIGSPGRFLTFLRPGGGRVTHGRRHGPRSDVGRLFATPAAAGEGVGLDGQQRRGGRLGLRAERILTLHGLRVLRAAGRVAA